MPWGRIDDSFYDHPKLDKLGDQLLPAVGLHALALSWCNRFLTDGLVPRERVSRLGGTVELAECLVGAELWEHAQGGYQIHDFLEYNDSAETVRRRRRDMRELGRKGAEARWRGANGDAPSGTLMAPSRPVIPIPSRPADRASIEAEYKRDPEVERMLRLQARALAERGKAG